MALTEAGSGGSAVDDGRRRRRARRRRLMRLETALERARGIASPVPKLYRGAGSIRDARRLGRVVFGGVLLVALTALCAVALVEQRTVQHVDLVGQVEDRALDLRLVTLNLEVGLRGYALTRRRVTLEPWSAASASVGPLVRTLAADVRELPDIAGAFARLRTGIRDYRAVYAPALLRAVGRDDRAAVTALTLAGKRRMDRLRSDLRLIISELRREDVAGRHRAADTAVVLLVLGICGLVAGGGGLLRLLRTEHREHLVRAQGLVQARTIDLESARVETLRRLARAAELRHDETQDHANRIGEMSSRIARCLHLDDAQCELLRLAAPLHDIGKIGIPDEVLLKPGVLTDEERVLMQTHARIGSELLSGSDSPLLEAAAVIAHAHHERWDGRGYPSGLAGEAIPLPARIVAVADVFDALTHDRPYKQAWPEDAALREMRHQAGRQFDPAVVEAFLGLRRQPSPPV